MRSPSLAQATDRFSLRMGLSRRACGALGHWSEAAHIVREGLGSTACAGCALPGRLCALVLAAAQLLGYLGYLCIAAWPSADTTPSLSTATDTHHSTHARTHARTYAHKTHADKRPSIALRLRGGVRLA